MQFKKGKNQETINSLTIAEEEIDEQTFCHQEIPPIAICQKNFLWELLRKKEKFKFFEKALTNMQIIFANFLSKWKFSRYYFHFYVCVRASTYMCTLANFNPKATHEEFVKVGVRNASPQADFWSYKLHRSNDFKTNRKY